MAFVMTLALTAMSPAAPPPALLGRLAAHHAYSARHCERTGAYAAYLAARLGLPASQVTDARVAGGLHDLGKISVPVAILDKPGKLTAQEWAVVRGHPALGAKLAQEAGLSPAVCAGIRGHHERPDGTGYPDGLKGDAIPLLARIVSVADTFDAVTSRRSYQPPRAFSAALAILRQAAGTQLDAKLVATFLLDEAALKALLDRQPHSPD